ncbi:CHAT domain-containing protein [Streptomyces sp. BE303]|uniref:CHAT domain-containing protein n=1 Tax=Streptomyces sp. BE303 TaxID=3002528 RepID=UPI002E7741BB|nr:CHAT domain-containing protein [Streptomyces sp. BE303]MED7952754.1 CHAT domain-containing protein [Streptomyces sp. BE303]
MDAVEPGWLPPFTTLIRIGEANASGAHPTLLAFGPAEEGGSPRPVHQGAAFTDECLSVDDRSLCRDLFETGAPLPEAVRTVAGLLRDALDALGLLGPWIEEVRTCHQNGRQARTLFDIRPAALRELPWELVTHADGAESLCVSGDPGLTFTRIDRPTSLLGAENPPAALHLPLRVLVVVGETDPLIRADEEIERIRTRLGGPSGEWHVEVVRAPTSRELAETLREVAPHVLHVIGHQQRDAGDRGLLTIRPPGTEPWSITGDNVHAFLAGHRPRLVVLNACDTAGPAAGPLLAALLRGGAAAVVGMNGGIESETACRFSAEFYTALGRGESVDRAVRTARLALLVDQVDGTEWALPVLAARVHPEVVLGRYAALRGKAEAEKRFTDRRWNLGHAVDRVRERRALFDGFAPTGPAAPVSAVVGEAASGKATLVRSALQIWYRNGARTVWSDLRPLGRTATWLDLVRTIVDQLGPAGPGLEPLQRFEHRLAQLHDGWTTDDNKPWLSLEPDRVWQETVPGNSVGHVADRRHTALRHLADALLGLGEDTGLVLALAGLGRLEHRAVADLIVPHLIEPLAVRPDGRAKVILALNEEEEADLLPYPLRDTVRRIPLGAFAAGEITEVVGDYSRVRDVEADSVEQWKEFMAILVARHGHLTPAMLQDGMTLFKEGRRVPR